MKLYYLPGACSLADHIVLEWTGLPYTVVAVPREELKTAYLAINPAGSVPALQLPGGEVIAQNLAILDYLAHLAPEAGLEGDGTLLGRANVLRWTAFLNSDVHKNFSPLFSAGQFVDGDEAQRDLCQKAAARLRRQFEQLDAQIGDGRWLVDDRRSIADPYLFVILRWARAKQLDLGELDNLARFFDAMNADAGVQAALKAEGLA